MSKPKQIRLLGFVKIKGAIEALTGLHIGGTADSIDKGGIDTPVIKNPVTNAPYIPGSSLRGRMRSLLEIKTGAELSEMSKGIFLEFYKDTPGDYNKALQSEVCRVFGNSASDPGLPSVLIVRDALLAPEPAGDYAYEKYMPGGLPLTEAKMEIVVDRITAHAMPRTIERVPAGARFDFEMIYKVQTYDNGLFEDNPDDPDNPAIKCNKKLQQDLDNILWALDVIEKHAGLGGNTSRGHGQVRFHYDDDSLEISPINADCEYEKPENNDAASLREAVKTITFEMKTPPPENEGKQDV